MIYFYFNPSDDDDDIPNEFIKFIEPFLTNIVIFDDLPNSFIDCSQRKEYVIDLNLNNFPLFFKRIYQCLDNKLTTLLNDEITTACKNQLSDFLDSMKKTTFSNHTEFTRIIKDCLPIFKTQNNKAFKTA